MQRGLCWGVINNNNGSTGLHWHCVDCWLSRSAHECSKVCILKIIKLCMNSVPHDIHTYMYTYIYIHCHWCIDAFWCIDALMHWLIDCIDDECIWCIWCIETGVVSECVSVRTKRFEKNFQFTITRYLYIWHVFFLYTLPFIATPPTNWTDLTPSIDYSWDCRLLRYNWPTILRCRSSKHQ